MPQNASRSAAALYDQFEDEHRVADWGGDELFTRMPRRRAVDNAPAPRFRPYLAASEPANPRSGSSTGANDLAERASGSVKRAPDPAEPGSVSATPAPEPAPESSLALAEPPTQRRPTRAAEERLGPGDRGGTGRTGERAMLARAERLGLSVVEPVAEPVRRWDDSGAMIEPQPAGRKTKLITGHPGGVPRPLATVRDERRRPSRTPSEWIGARPERIVAWAFALGLILILIAISTADAATL
jgi:hypothetical protein